MSASSSSTAVLWENNSCAGRQDQLPRQRRLRLWPRSSRASLRQASPRNKQPRSPPQASSPTSRLSQQACGTPPSTEPQATPKKAPPSVPTDDDEPAPAKAAPAHVNVVAQTIASGPKAPRSNHCNHRRSGRRNNRLKRNTTRGTSDMTTSSSTHRLGHPRRPDSSRRCHNWAGAPGLHQASCPSGHPCSPCWTLATICLPSCCPRCHIPPREIHQFPPDNYPCLAFAEDAPWFVNTLLMVAMESSLDYWDHGCPSLASSWMPRTDTEPGTASGSCGCHYPRRARSCSRWSPSPTCGPS